MQGSWRWQGRVVWHCPGILGWTAGTWDDIRADASCSEEGVWHENCPGSARLDAIPEMKFVTMIVMHMTS